MDWIEQNTPGTGMETRRQCAQIEVSLSGSKSTNPTVSLI